MSIPKVARIMAFLLIFQQAKCVFSCPLNLPPLRNYPRHKKFMARGFRSYKNREVPLMMPWASHDNGATVSEFVPEIIRKRPNKSANKNLLVDEEVKAKRKGHEAAKLYRNRFNQCLIINDTGKVESSANKRLCYNFGVFCHITNGSTFKLRQIRRTPTKKYLAIDSNGTIYSTTNANSKDTDFTYVGNPLKFNIGIYRKLNDQKCYLKVIPHVQQQTCSTSPSYFKPENLGDCN